MPRWEMALLPWDLLCSPGRSHGKGTQSVTKSGTDIAATRPNRPSGWQSLKINVFAYVVKKTLKKNQVLSLFQKVFYGIHKKKHWFLKEKKHKGVIFEDIFFTAFWYLIFLSIFTIDHVRMSLSCFYKRYLKIVLPFCNFCWVVTKLIWCIRP